MKYWIIGKIYNTFLIYGFTNHTRKVYYLRKGTKQLSRHLLILRSVWPIKENCDQKHLRHLRHFCYEQFSKLYHDPFGRLTLAAVFTREYRSNVKRTSFNIQDRWFQVIASCTNAGATVTFRKWYDKNCQPVYVSLNENWTVEDFNDSQYFTG